MLCNDPIADMLTRIRNALIARHETVTIPASNMKKSIAQILLDEGYVKSVDYIDDGLQGQIKIVLKYAQGKESVIKGLKRIWVSPSSLRPRVSWPTKKLARPASAAKFWHTSGNKWRCNQCLELVSSRSRYRPESLLRFPTIMS